MSPSNIQTFRSLTTHSSNSQHFSYIYPLLIKILITKTNFRYQQKKKVVTLFRYKLEKTNMT